MAKMKIMGGGPSCTCTPGSFVWLVIGVIIVALGIWAGVKGLMMQWGGSMDWMRIAFWYALGLLVICIGKVVKCKACPSCFTK
jgi:hypothetical protein